jgi:ribosome recycling factor
MSAEQVYMEAGEKMEKAVSVLESHLRGIRTGRASTGLVENLRIDYYGSPTPLNQIANIATPDPQLIVIRPFDPSALKDIEKALLASDIGITPNSDGKLIRLSVPPLSEERRKQLAGQVKTQGEQAKVAIRNVRRDANKEIDKLKDDKAISEDDAFKTKDEIQELTKDSEKKVDDVIKKKSDEILTF